MVRHKQNEMFETQSKRLKVKSPVGKIIRLIDVQGCAMWEPKVLNNLASKLKVKGKKTPCSTFIIII